MQLVAASLLLVGLGGLAGLSLLSFGSTLLLRAFSGSAYVAGAIYLPWYALGMMLLGAAAVLIATHQSRGRPGFLAILLPLAVLEPVLIVAFHQTPLQVVQVVDFSMGLVAAGLAAWYVIGERSERAVAQVPIGGLQTAPQLQVNR
jgi:hypothetical protein